MKNLNINQLWLIFYWAVLHSDRHRFLRLVNYFQALSKRIIMLPCDMLQHVPKQYNQNMFFADIRSSCVIICRMPLVNLLVLQNLISARHSQWSKKIVFMSFLTNIICLEICQNWQPHALKMISRDAEKTEEVNGRSGGWGIWGGPQMLWPSMGFPWRPQNRCRWRPKLQFICSPCPASCHFHHAAS